MAKGKKPPKEPLEDLVIQPPLKEEPEKAADEPLPVCSGCGCEECKQTMEELKAGGPIRTAFSIYRKNGGWVMCEYKIQGSKVVEALETIEDFKHITLEKFKLAVARKLINPPD